MVYFMSVDGLQKRFVGSYFELNMKGRRFIEYEKP